MGSFWEEDDPTVRGDLLDEGLRVLEGSLAGEPFSVKKRAW